jgi:predicted  nucleic acid-binding Zn-ribbon protein
LEQLVQEIILKLISLQDLDNKIRNWHQITEEAPSRLQEAREKLTSLEADWANLETKLAENAAKRRELEAETEDLTQRMTTNQSRQLKARNNNEYRAVMKEAETITTNLTSKEDELLKVLDEGEKLQTLRPLLSVDCENEAKIFAQREADIKAVIEDGQRNEAEANIRRKELLLSIPPTFLSRYNTIAQNRDGQAMAPVVQGMCRICRLSIPPQLYNELQKNDKLLTCPNCARILYWMHHPYFQDFCTEPNPQVQTDTTDKTEKKPKTDNSKRRRNSKPKEAKQASEIIDNKDQEDDPTLDDQTVASI